MINIEEIDVLIASINAYNMAGKGFIIFIVATFKAEWNIRRCWQPSTQPVVLARSKPIGCYGCCVFIPIVGNNLAKSGETPRPAVVGGVYITILYLALELVRVCDLGSI